MQEVTEKAVRDALDEFYEQEKFTKKKEYFDRITSAAMEIGADPDKFKAAIEAHDLTEEPVKESANLDAFGNALSALKQVYTSTRSSVLYTGSLIDKSVIERIGIDEEDTVVSTAALGYVAAKLLNVRVLSTAIEQEVDDESSIVRVWYVNTGGWTDKERGKEMERRMRLKHMRDQVVSLERSYLDSKKRLVEFGATLCTCADDLLDASTQ
jgi:hypothetical protein